MNFNENLLLNFYICKRGNITDGNKMTINKMI